MDATHTCASLELHVYVFRSARAQVVMVRVDELLHYSPLAVSSDEGGS